MVAGMLSDIKCHKRKIQKEKQKQRSDEDVVRELVRIVIKNIIMTTRKLKSHSFFSPQQCSNNGICYERLGDVGCDISSLEMFFSGFPRMVGLSFFPGLRQLTIVGQSLKRIEALDCCPHLEELWVAECHLTVRLFIYLCYVFNHQQEGKTMMENLRLVLYFCRKFLDCRIVVSCSNSTSMITRSVK